MLKNLNSANNLNWSGTYAILTGYTKSNSGHIVLNTAAADDFRTVYPPLRRYLLSKFYPDPQVFL